MRIFVLGGTGTIGAAVVRELLGHGHEVTALARSEAAAARLTAAGAQVQRGDLRDPRAWVSRLPALDALVHAAATFAPDEEAVDRGLLDALLPALQARPHPMRLLYTGGSWLYGAGTSAASTEDTPFDPLAAFAWGVRHVQRVLGAAEQSPGLQALVIHPAMVFEAGGGVFRSFHEDARERRAVRVVGAESVCWPLVHAADLAALYRLALEHAPAGESYLGVAIESFPVGRIARAFARRFGTERLEPEIVSVEDAVSAQGEWARGYALSQRQSGAKARRDLGWAPHRLDPEAEIATLGA